MPDSAGGLLLIHARLRDTNTARVGHRTTAASSDPEPTGVRLELASLPVLEETEVNAPRLRVGAARLRTSTGEGNV